MPKTKKDVQVKPYKPRTLEKCEVKGFTNSGKKACFRAGEKWIRNQSVFPEGQEAAFKLLSKCLKEKDVGKLYYVHRWMGRKCVAFSKGSKSPVCEKRLMFLKNNWDSPYMVPFSTREEINREFNGRTRSKGLVVNLSDERSGYIRVYIVSDTGVEYVKEMEVGDDGNIEYDGYLFTYLADLAKYLQQRKVLTSSEISVMDRHK